MPRDQRVDPVAVALGVREALEQHHADALARHHAVGRAIEGLGVALLREGRRLAERHILKDRGVGIHAAGDRQIAAALEQLADGHLERAERAGAGRIDHAVHPAEVQPVGDAPGDHVAEEARHGVLVHSIYALSCARRSDRSLARAGRCRAARAATPGTAGGCSTGC